MAANKRITLIVILWFVSVFAQANPLGMVLMRTHAPAYAPGLSVEIVVTIEAASTEGLHAMGLYEALPEGWRFEGVNAGGNGLPAIVPVLGDGPQLEFAWIATPVLPCSFSYMVMPSEDSWGVKEIHGVLEYRLAEGPYYLPDTVTMLTGPEETAPSLELNGDQVMELVQGDVWEEPGYTALDARQQDISSRVVVMGEVLTDTPGSYTMRYSVSSASGEKVTEVERVVHVLLSETQEKPESGAGVVLAPPGVLLEKEAPKLQKMMDKMAQALQKGEGLNADNKALHNRIQFPELDVLRPVVSEQEVDGESVEEASVAHQEEESIDNIEKEAMEKSAPKQLEVLSSHSIPNVKSESRTLLEKQNNETQRHYGYGILVLAVGASLGVIAGAWFVFRLGGRRRAPGRLEKKNSRR